MADRKGSPRGSSRGSHDWQLPSSAIEFQVLPRATCFPMVDYSDRAASGLTASEGLRLQCVWERLGPTMVAFQTCPLAASAQEMIVHS